MEGTIEIEGKTVQDAIENGLKQLGLKRDEVEIKILSEGAPGLFGLMGSKAAKISMWPKMKAEGGKTIASQAQFSVSQKISDEIRKSLLQHMTEIISLMKISEKRPLIKVETSDAGFSIDINFQDSEDGSLLIGKGGRTLSALGTIIQSIINHEFKDKITNSPLPRISVDINQYRIRQEEKTKDNVARILDTVRKTGKPYRLNPMPAKMRRVVHISLKDNPEFESFSEGEGDMRRVVIKPRTSPLESENR